MHRPFLITVFGKRGSGKSHLIRRIMALVRRELSGPIFVLDTMNEFRDGLQFHNAHEFYTYLVNRGRNDSGTYILNAKTEADGNAFFAIINALQIPCTVFVDEISKFSSPYNINPDLNDLIQYGRHAGVSIVGAARRTSEVRRDLTAQSDVIVSFRQTEPGDVAKLKPIFSDAVLLPSLNYARHEFILLGDADTLPEPLTRFLESNQTRPKA